MRSCGLSFSRSLNPRYSHEIQELLRFFHHFISQVSWSRCVFLRKLKILLFKCFRIHFGRNCLDFFSPLDGSALQFWRFAVKYIDKAYPVLKEVDVAIE